MSDPVSPATYKIYQLILTGTAISMTDLLHTYRLTLVKKTSSNKTMSYFTKWYYIECCILCFSKWNLKKKTVNSAFLHNARNISISRMRLKFTWMYGVLFAGTLKPSAIRWGHILGGIWCSSWSFLNPFLGSRILILFCKKSSCWTRNHCENFCASIKGCYGTKC